MFDRYTHSVDHDAQYPALGYWGGDEAKAVDFYIDVLKYAYMSLQKQLDLLDPRFYMVREPAMLLVVCFLVGLRPGMT